MLTILGRTLRIFAARWPMILALYLAGWLVRYGVIEVAAFVGSTNATIAVLILPIAVIARLGSYIAIFLVMRGSMPTFSDMRARGVDSIEVDANAAPRRQRASDIFLVSILPFFAFYAAWQFLREDYEAYVRAALAKVNFFDDIPDAHVDQLQFGPLVVAIIVIAFIIRLVLKRYKDKLPRWVAIPSVYFEALWVYLTLFLIVDYFVMAREWLTNRAVIAALIDLKNSTIAAVAWIADSTGWLLNETGGIVLLPIAWLTLAGVVYGRALAAPKLAYRPTNRVYTRVSERVAALPEGVVARLKDVGSGVTDRVVPITNALGLIWKAGVAPMGVYVLAFTVLEAASQWLFRGAIQLIGPHDTATWWMNVDDILGFAITAIVGPLQLCLIAAAYDYCLRKLEERREAEPSDLEVEPEVVG